MTELLAIAYDPDRWNANVRRAVAASIDRKVAEDSDDEYHAGWTELWEKVCQTSLTADEFVVYQIGVSQVIGENPTILV